MPATTGPADPAGLPYYGGPSGKGDYGIAVGSRAIAIGDYGVAIGFRANAPANGIVLNARATLLNGTTANAFYVAPVRGVATSTPVLVYNTATSEITCKCFG